MDNPTASEEVGALFARHSSSPPPPAMFWLKAISDMCEGNELVFAEMSDKQLKKKAAHAIYASIDRKVADVTFMNRDSILARAMDTKDGLARVKSGRFLHSELERIGLTATALRLSTVREHVIPSLNPLTRSLSMHLSTTPVAVMQRVIALYTYAYLSNSDGLLKGIQPFMELLPYGIPVMYFEESKHLFVLNG